MVVPYNPLSNMNSEVVLDLTNQYAQRCGGPSRVTAKTQLNNYSTIRTSSKLRESWKNNYKTVSTSLDVENLHNTTLKHLVTRGEE